jgi:virulence-associated protein VapD
VYSLPKDEDLANLFSAIDALRSMEWFGPSVKNIRAFRNGAGVRLHGNREGAAVIEIISGAEAL